MCPTERRPIGTISLHFKAVWKGDQLVYEIILPSSTTWIRGHMSTGKRWAKLQNSATTTSRHEPATRLTDLKSGLIARWAQRAESPRFNESRDPNKHRVGYESPERHADGFARRLALAEETAPHRATWRPWYARRSPTRLCRAERGPAWRSVRRELQKAADAFRRRNRLYTAAERHARLAERTRPARWTTSRRVSKRTCWRVSSVEHVTTRPGGPLRAAAPSRLRTAAAGRGHGGPRGALPVNWPLQVRDDGLELAGCRSRPRPDAEPRGSLSQGLARPAGRRCSPSHPSGNWSVRVATARDFTLAVVEERRPAELDKRHAAPDSCTSCSTHGWSNASNRPRPIWLWRRPE